MTELELYREQIKEGDTMLQGTVDKRFDYNILLIGFMGTGKSTVADCLSGMFGMQNVEMDQVIEERQQMSISKIFETYGEEYFRNLETDLLVEIQGQKNTIVSCGGGVPLFERNVVEMKKNSRVVLLTAKLDTILERVKENDDRPLLQGNKNADFIKNLMNQRREKYEAVADVVIETDERSVTDICEEIISKLCK